MRYWVTLEFEANNHKDACDTAEVLVDNLNIGPTNERARIIQVDSPPNLEHVARPELTPEEAWALIYARTLASQATDVINLELLRSAKAKLVSARTINLYTKLSDPQSHTEAIDERDSTTGPPTSPA